MARHFPGGRLVLASHNAGKVREIRDLLAPYAADVAAASEFDLAEPEETGDTFRANAELKALAATMATSLPALADDSGLVVPLLGGDPGIYSARWAGPGKDFAVAMERVWQRLTEAGARTPNDYRAHFIAVLSLAWPDGHVDSFEGRVHGMLVWPPRGDRGFGYDPMFLPEGQTVTFGEMEPGKKHAISHRAAAFRQLIDGCFGR